MNPRAYEIQDELNGGALDKITAASDIKVEKLTDEEREAFVEPAQKAYDVYKDLVGEDGAAILDELIAEIEAYEAE